MSVECSRFLTAIVENRTLRRLSDNRLCLRRLFKYSLPERIDAALLPIRLLNRSYVEPIMVIAGTRFVRTGPFARPRDHRAPRTALESKLVGLWEELLGVSPIGIGDDFFALGGSSLDSADLILRIEREFDSVLPISCLLNGPTIADLARLIEARGAVEWPSLVPLRSSGTRPPLYVVHDILGGIFSYRTLSDKLDPDQPVFGIRPQTGGRVPVKVEEMAADYVAEIVAARPHGRIILAGYSFGATVAYEMAQQLQALGRTIPLLVLIDPRRPNLDPALPWTARATTRLATNFCIRAFRDSRSAVKSEIVEAIRELWSRPHSKAVRASPGINFERMHYAFRAYRPEPYSGSTLLLRARFQPLFRWHEPRMGWGELLTGSVAIRPLPCIHADIFDSGPVAVLAHHFETALRSITVEIPPVKDGMPHSNLSDCRRPL